MATKKMHKKAAKRLAGKRLGKATTLKTALTLGKGGSLIGADPHFLQSTGGDAGSPTS